MTHNAPRMGGMTETTTMEIAVWVPTETFKWTDELTAVLIVWRAANDKLFTGRRNAAVKGFEEFVREKGLEGKTTPTWVKKKWENLKQKYKDMKTLSGVSTEGEATAASWKWFDAMEVAMGGRPSISLSAFIASASHDAAVASPPIKTEPRVERLTPAPQRKRKGDVLLYLRVMKMKALQVIYLTLLAVLAARAQVLVAGKCPRPAVVKFFDASMYQGKWYEIQKLPVLFQQGECATATYSQKKPGENVEVLNKELLPDGSIYSVVGSAMATNSSEPAKMEVYYSPTSLPSPYWVLSTDYWGHALVFGCIDYGLFHAQFAWILSRQPILLKKTLKDLQDLLASAGVNVDKMITTNQNEAFCRAMRLL
ncbi:unnamed protein product [Merluccius merluccius]